MILTCPECSARFVVKSEVIGEKGRKVKCAKCSHVWFQTPPTEEEKAQEAIQDELKKDSIPDGGNLPAVKERTNIPFVAVILSGILVNFLIAAVVLVSGGLSEDVTGMTLYHTKYEVIKDDKYEDLLVKGVIANESDEEKAVPILRIALFDEEGEELKVIELDNSATMLAPGEEMDFENKIPRMPKATTKVVMDLGNGLDLASR